jgi:hypothetical protein
MNLPSELQSRLVVCLRDYVDNDDVNLGDPENATWIEILENAQAALAEVDRVTSENPAGPRRAIRINRIDGTHEDLELSKAASVDTKASMINLDRLNDGTWRLIYDRNLIPDITQVASLEIIREN